MRSKFKKLNRETETKSLTVRELNTLDTVSD